jgi:hypothetical protein
MAGVHGEAFYGRVDRVPGLFVVATRFFHINFIPLVPIAGHLLFDTPSGPAGGVKIPLSGKSVFVGYYRGWVGAAAAVLLGLGFGFAAETVAVPAGMALGLAAGVGLTVAAVRPAGPVWWAGLAAAVAASAAVLAWDANRPPPAGNRRPPEPVADLLLAGNALLGSVGLMRAFDRAGRRRAYELAALVGLPPEVVDAAFDGPAAVGPGGDET